MSEQKEISVKIKIIISVVLSLIIITMIISNEYATYRNKNYYLSIIQKIDKIGIQRSRDHKLHILNTSDMLRVKELLKKSESPPPYAKAGTYDVQYDLVIIAENLELHAELFKNVSNAVVFMHIFMPDNETILFNVIDENNLFLELEKKYIDAK